MSFSTGPPDAAADTVRIEGDPWGRSTIKRAVLFTRLLGMLPVFSQLYSTGDESTLESWRWRLRIIMLVRRP